jgi:hypothetical protein
MKKLLLISCLMVQFVPAVNAFSESEILTANFIEEKLQQCMEKEDDEACNQACLLLSNLMPMDGDSDLQISCALCSERSLQCPRFREEMLKKLKQNKMELKDIFS